MRLRELRLAFEESREGTQYLKFLPKWNKGSSGHIQIKYLRLSLESLAMQTGEGFSIPKSVSK
jgi:hypothetical protein